MLYSLKYTDDIKEGFGGIAFLWFIRIRPKYKDDTGILEHEKTHVHQFWRTCGIHSLIYGIIKRYRLKSEVEAYREQLKYYPATTDIEHYRDYFAGSISTKYSLDITHAEALELLK